MTRKEEIVKATKEFRELYTDLVKRLTSDDIADAFEEGAEWADKTMIEKVEEWLRINNRAQLIGSLNRFLKKE